MAHLSQPPSQDDLYDRQSVGRTRTRFGDLSEPDKTVEHWIDVRCEPVIDILYVKILPVSDAICGVYGNISILTSDGSEYLLYDRKQFDSPQRISPMQNLLQLSGPEEIPTLDEPQLFFDIRDVDTGSAVFVSHRIPLNKTTHPYGQKFEQLTYLKLQDATGSVELQYVSFTFGVYARVQIFLCKDDDTSNTEKQEDDEKGVELFGLIHANCNPLILARENCVNHMFNVIEDEHEWVGLGTEIVLSKNLVAVPAYSELEISVDLSGYGDDKFTIQGTACFEPMNYYGGGHNIRGTNGFNVRIEVTWCEPSRLNKHWSVEDKIGCFLTVPDLKPEIYASCLLEVFSLFISRPNDKAVSLYGSVKILDSRGFCSIFNCSENEAYFLASGCKLLPLQGPKRSLTPGMFFYIEVDLRDVDGHVKIQGSAHSSVGIDERTRPWFDRQLCSVVKGVNEKSFAAVNYVVFSYAVQASVTIRLVSKWQPNAPVMFYGDIIAKYDHYSYLSTFDSEFFLNVLFRKEEANSLEVGENLELSRRLVAVPMTSPLFILVNLFFQSDEGEHVILDVKRFQIGESYKVIESKLFCIQIDVNWKGLPYYQ